MSYIQEKYKLIDMIELSTLTGAMVVALGKNRAGLFSNSDQFSTRI
jgi:leucyl aminopeptidase